jgi:hypothetical protein
VCKFCFCCCSASKIFALYNFIIKRF